MQEKPLLFLKWKKEKDEKCFLNVALLLFLQTQGFLISKSCYKRRQIRVNNPLDHFKKHGFYDFFQKFIFLILKSSLKKSKNNFFDTFWHTFCRFFFDFLVEFFFWFIYCNFAQQVFELLSTITSGRKGKKRVIFNNTLPSW